MDELWLRELLDRAVADEPPIGPVADNSLRAWMRQRRRRRAQGSAMCVTAAAVIAATSLVLTGAARSPGTGPATAARPSTLYVLSIQARGAWDKIRGTLTPIPSATNVPGKPISVGAVGGPQAMAITPDGKTIYLGWPNAVLPVSTVTDTAGKPVQLGQMPSQILITPNGKTAYVLTLSAGPSEIIPIATATNSPGKAIKVGLTVGGPYQMAITPDGKTLYVISFNKGGAGPSYVIPIATATNTPGKPIKIENADAVGLVMNPDGKTVYAIGQFATATLVDVVPITTATNTPGKPVTVGPAAEDLAITPGGRILYFGEYGASGVTPFATATSTPGKLIRIHGVLAIAVAPDGKTAYVSSEPKTNPEPFCTGQTGELTPVSTATNVPGRPIQVGCRPYLLAITPDGQTVWVASGQNTVTPIATATNTAGKPIKFSGSIAAIAITP
jgi:DNA-binding beta-propeller fold protein YncE